MRLTEIISESTTITERPMGILKKAGLGLASKVSSKAAGKLASGNEANELKKDFDFYLGSSNQKATANSLMQFLNQEGYSTDAAQKAIANIPGADQNPETPLPKNVIDQVFTSLGQSNVSTGKVTPTQATNSPQTNLNMPAATKSPNINQVKSAVEKMDNYEKRELIKHLKAVGALNDT
jgi:hypothetical protein